MEAGQPSAITKHISNSPSIKNSRRTLKMKDQIVRKKEEYSKWRKMIHANPELAYQEFDTSNFVVEKLKSFGIPFKRDIAGTGIIASIKNGSGTKAIALRADMDALPIHELNTFEHKSKNHGLMHACGHDGHTVMLLAAADYLARKRNFDGIVHMIFQPAEEGEAGARAMINDGIFNDFKIDSVYALHNWPGLEAGLMGFRVGPIMAAFDTFKLTVRSNGGHAALPHLANDTIQTAVQIISMWQNIISRKINPIDPAVLSVTKIHGGDAWAVIPESVEIGGTVRTFKKETQKTLENQMLDTVKLICSSNGCTFDWDYEKRYPETTNTAAETNCAVNVARAVCGEKNVKDNIDMVTGSEDFGFMLREKPGCYGFIGNGSEDGGRMLHSSYYDFNDKLIPIGASYWATLVEKILTN